MEKAIEYRSPLDNPISYPGKKADNSNVLAQGQMRHIDFLTEYESGCLDATGATRRGRVEGTTRTIEQFLDEQGVAGLTDRYAIMGYGSNLVPGQLVSKLGEGVIVSINAGIVGADVVYNPISDHGYAQAELLLGQDGVRGNVGIVLLDDRQMEKIITQDPNKTLRISPLDVTLQSGETMAAEDGRVYLFAGTRKIWAPDGPIGIAERHSTGRRIEEKGHRDVLEFSIGYFGLPYKDADHLITSIRDDRGIAQDIRDMVDKDKDSRASVASQLQEIEFNPDRKFQVSRRRFGGDENRKVIF
jgi:hypothetical protein